MGKGVTLATLVWAALAATAAAAQSDDGPLVIVSNWSTSPVARGDAVFRAAMMKAHDEVRARAGVEPLRWDDALAADAAQYANQMAGSGQFEHASEPARSSQGENLWMGTKRAFTYLEIIASWVDEGEAYQPGRFPAVSRTGSWHDVGHYTQMIWSGSKKVGCALASNRTDDYVVCRYWPAGNVYGDNPLGVQKTKAVSLANAAAR